jgi:hypothetical protein
MTIPEIYQLWITGKSLPALTQRAAHGLLDMARNAVLTKGKAPKFSVAPACPTGEKRSLLAAGDQLRELGIAEEAAIYASAAPSVGPDPHWTVDRVGELLAATKKNRAVPTAKPAAGLVERTQAEFARSKELGRQLDAQRTPKPITRVPTAAPAKSSTPARPTVATTAAPSAHARDIARAILDETEARRVASLTKSRAEFEKLSPREASAFCRAGGKITA